MTAPIYVAVVGAGEPDAETTQLAEEVGRLIAQRGALLVTGGLGGVMEAASRGAKSADGTTVGILPGNSRAGANAHLDVALPTGMGEARNALVVRAADVVIAVAGEYGTLSEIALALRIGTPVVGLKTWELHRKGEPVHAFETAESPEEAVDLAFRFASPSPSV